MGWAGGMCKAGFQFLLEERERRKEALHAAGIASKHVNARKTDAWGTRASSLQDFGELTTNFDMAFVLAGRGEVIGQLHLQPRFRGAAESL
jgi:hypothetical protein